MLLLKEANDFSHWSMSHAKRNKDTNKDVIHFYKKMGFELYKDRGNKETPMYMDIFPFIQTN